MNRSKLTIAGIVVVALGIIAFGALFTVHQTQQALVLQFGDPKRVIQTPGLKLKLPFVQNVVYYDRRVLDLDPPVEQIILADQKRLDMDSFVRYRIVDPLRFFQAVQDERGVRARLSNVVIGALRRVLGNVTLLSVLSVEREEVMRQIRQQVNAAADPYGVEIIDFRLRRADLPEQASQATYARMRSEREREARETRAQGFEKGQQVRASADRERTVLIAEAKRTAEILRGEGDNTAVRIYAEAAMKDQEFYRFYRSMEAYRKGLSPGDTTLVLSPSSEFFRYFGDIKGFREPAARK